MSDHHSLDEIVETIRVDVERDAHVPVDRYDHEQARREIQLLRAHRRYLLKKIAGLTTELHENR